MPIKAVIFDFGGVLVRTHDDTGRRKWEQKLGIGEGEIAGLIFNSRTSHLAATGKAPTEDVWNHFARDFGLTEEEINEFHKDFWSGDKLDMQLVEYLKKLRPHYKTAILSNAWSNAREVFSNQYGLAEVVDEMVISAEEGVAKPEARIYEIVAERLNIQPDEAVFVDDMLINIEAARTAGMCGVHFRSTEQTIADVQRCLQNNS